MLFCGMLQPLFQKSATTIEISSVIVIIDYTEVVPLMDALCKTFAYKLTCKNYSTDMDYGC